LNKVTGKTYHSRNVDYIDYIREGEERRDGKGGEKRGGKEREQPQIKCYEYSTGNTSLLQWPNYILASPPPPVCIFAYCHPE
jgi:hypothetical protein